MLAGVDLTRLFVLADFSPSPAGPCGRSDRDDPPLLFFFAGGGGGRRAGVWFILATVTSLELPVPCALPSLRGALIELDDSSCIVVVPGRS